MVLSIRLPINQILQYFMGLLKTVDYKGLLGFYDINYSSTNRE